MKRYDTIIFDLDGTLLNTLEDLTDSVNYALTLFDFPRRDSDEIRRFLGNGVAKLIERSIPNGIDNPYYEKCLAEFRTHYSDNMQNKTCAYEGILELLSQLLKQGYKIAIVSNKFDAAVKKLNQDYFAKYIKVAIGESENVSKKPAPDSVFKAIEELGSTLDRTLYVGDSEVDVETARNAGIKCVGVTWGFRGRAILEDEGADFIIDKPQQLFNILATFREMRKKERELELKESIEILRNGEYGILSTVGECGYAYGVPVSYVYINDAIYFHCAKEGQKLDNILSNNKVSFCVVGQTCVLPEKFSTKYESVIIFGTANEIFEDEKNTVLLEIVKKYSPNFLDKGKEYIARAAASTTVIKINIEHITGKARR